MTAEQFKELMDALGWSNVHLSDLLQCNQSLVQRWSAGKAPVPTRVAKWLTKLAVFHEQHPPPTDWRVL